ncbi:ATP-binding protein [Reinekea blandensis]|uniref:histidine kinase n=1 Tax=Reinekea blandensis MED297 TaxID=314283 RepID=A4BII0_9GAMM|nr:ATP-binding protein [Reinekea blandensis]EAR08059.1 sensor histidine kinase [Reinekea sp. MED297] [Reinekea blandensis MED297]
MFNSIRVKLFSLIVLGNVLMVGLLMALNAASFSRSFSDYIAQQEGRRLQPLIENIAEEYQRQGDWRWVGWDKPTWVRVVQSSMSRREMRLIDRFSKDRMPGPPMNGGYFDRLVLREAGTDDLLLGAAGRKDQHVWIPVTSTSSAQPIAYLGFVPSARLDSRFDDLFARQQQRQLVIIGLAGILIAGLLAIPFSGWLVRPIQRLSGAVREMTQGDLSVSVPEERRDELGRLAADFNRLARALQKNQQDRQQLVSDIAHELRTPVAIFLADIEAAQDGVRQVDEAWLVSMHAQVVRLTQLVNDLHQLSQSDAGALSYRFDRVDLTEQLNGFLERSFPVSDSDGLTLQWVPPAQPLWVRADQARLTQLFNNLLQNTLRYTDRPGTLHVRLDRAGGQVKLNWEDSYPGVGDDDLPRLFDRLYRVESSRSRDSGGAGLGLAIVANIVTAHDGHIQALHSAAGGLRIELTLPDYEDFKA